MVLLVVRVEVQGKEICVHGEHFRNGVRDWEMDWFKRQAEKEKMIKDNRMGTQ